MAKAQKRGNREAKKPKQEKPKDVAPSSPFAVTPGKMNTPPRQGDGKR